MSTEQPAQRDIMVVMNSIHFNTVLIWNMMKEMHPEVADRIFDQTVEDFPKMVLVDVDESEDKA